MHIKIGVTGLRVVQGHEVEERGRVQVKVLRLPLETKEETFPSIYKLLTLGGKGISNT